MRVIGGPFYDPDEWEPDGPTLKEIIAWWHGSVMLSPHQLYLIQMHFQQSVGAAWRSAMQRFVDELTPIMEQGNKVVQAMVPAAEAVKHKPPKNGPQFNPHARHGKGGKRR